MTAVANTAFAAAQWNTHARDNLLETAPAKATTAGRLFVATGLNSIAERAFETARVDTSETTTSTSYTGLATALSVTVTTGTRALVIISAHSANSGTGGINAMSYAVSGATTDASNDNRAFATEGNADDVHRGSVINLHTGLTAGSNTFTGEHKVSGGTGTWQRRTISVLGL